MHPANSVIFFTTASGAGYGLLFLLGLAVPAGLLPAERWFGLAAMALSLGLIGAGLISSTFHLGHPERAWRAFSQWRSSWLSREGVSAVATFVPAGLFAIGWVFLETAGGLWALAGLLGALGAVVTVVCTGMIYASLKPVHRWHNGWVVPVYLGFALMTGALSLSALTHCFGVAALWSDGLALAAVTFAWTLKVIYWRETDEAQAPSTPESATGLGTIGKVRLLDPPHTEENYLMREMGFRVARKHAKKLRRIALFLGFKLPFVLMLAAFFAPGGFATAASLLAALSGIAGVALERWLFFAEAKHTVMLYYGAEAA